MRRAGSTGRPRPARFNFGQLAIDRLNLTGRIALHDAASRSTLELNDIAFSGDVRSLAGSIRGDGNFLLVGTRYPFRVSSGQTQDGNGTRVHLNIDPGQRALAIDLDGVLAFDQRAPRFDGAVTLARPVVKARSRGRRRGGSRPRSRPIHAAARLDQLEVSYGPEERALRLAGTGEASFGAAPLLRASLSARQLDVDRFVAKDNSEPSRCGYCRQCARCCRAFRRRRCRRRSNSRPSRSCSADGRCRMSRPSCTATAGLGRAQTGIPRARVDAGVAERRAAQAVPTGTISRPRSTSNSADPDALITWLQGRSDLAYRSQKPLRLRGDVSIAPNGFALDGMKAEFDGGAVEGRVAVSHGGRTAARGSRRT